jgi:hypothetical protein
MAETRYTGHCRHCLGDCPGTCRLDDSGRCIHGWDSRPPHQIRWQAVLTRTWWHRLLWGTYSHQLAPWPVVGQAVARGTSRNVPEAACGPVTVPTICGP